MSDEQKKQDGLNLLKRTLSEVATGRTNASATERMRAALALAYLLKSIPPLGDLSPEAAAHGVLSWEQKSARK